MSENTFYERVNSLQSVLVAPKSNYNSFGKYKYRSAEDILEAVKPLNKEHGVFLSITDEPVLIGDWHYIKSTAKLIDTKDPNNQIEVTAYARESHTKKGMDDSQITGTASSYARKYALNGLYLIDDTKDADTDEYQNKQQRTPSKPITSEQIGHLKVKALELAQLRNKKDTDVYQALGIKDIEKLTEDQAKDMMRKLHGWIKSAEKETVKS